MVDLSYYAPLLGVDEAILDEWLCEHTDWDSADIDAVLDEAASYGSGSWLDRIQDAAEALNFEIIP